MTTTNTTLIQGLAAHLRAKTAYEAAVQARSEYQTEYLEREARGLYGEAWTAVSDRLYKEDPAFLRLREESFRAQEVMSALERWPIAANLEVLGLPDPAATAVVTVVGEYDDTIERRRVISVTRLEGRNLSELAGLRKWRIAESAGVNRPDPRGPYREVRVEIEVDGQTVGSVDSDGRFAYRGAPDFRTIVGWFCATDLGRTGLLPVDPMSVAEELREAVRAAGVSDETYSNVYRPLELQLFARDRLTRFGTVSGHFWSLLTRELSNE